MGKDNEENPVVSGTLDESIARRKARFSDSDKERLKESLREQLKDALTEEQFNDLFGDK